MVKQKRKKNIKSILEIEYIRIHNLLNKTTTKTEMNKIKQLNRGWLSDKINDKESQNTQQYDK